jgi:hypothetical protein
MLSDLLDILAGPSTSHGVMELEQIQVLNDVHNNENIGEYRSETIVFITQLLLLRTNMITDSENDNDYDEQEHKFKTGRGVQ